MTKKDRQKVFEKFGGRCAYTGTVLEDDWQVDHIEPRISFFFKGNIKDADNIDNYFPAQKIVNHYKRGLPLESFRTWFLAGLHERLKKLPRNPHAKNSIRRKEYLLKVASYFGITEDKPFSGVFYFETLKSN